MEKVGVYILKSVKNHTYYVGSTNDLERRIRQHNTGLVKSTKNVRPFIFAVFLPCQNLSEARKSERRLKNYKRKNILDKVIKDGLFPWEYKGPVV